jgi:hypothetical protein
MRLSDLVDCRVHCESKKGNKTDFGPIIKPELLRQLNDNIIIKDFLMH